ncbi:MAG: MFS transporter [Candidatus Thorarchaeota archaeon]
MSRDKANSIQNQSSADYRAWPVFLLAFVRLFYVSIFERALSNYLLWEIGIESSLLGFISSTGAITYIFAPILGQLITTKFLGIRNALILTSISTPIFTGLQILYPEAWFLIVCRILLGLTLGFFWPNCLNLLSKWQKFSTFKKSKKNFAFFNLSWNTGFIIGLIVGFFWAFIWGDFFAIIISWLLSFLLIPPSFFIKKEIKPDLSKEIVIYQSEDPLSHLDIKEDLVVNLQTPMIVFPVIFSWISIMFLTISKSIFVFGYQFLVDNSLSDEFSYLTYLVQCGIQIMQLLGLTWINSMKTYNRKLSSLLSIIFIAIISSTVAFMGNIWYISIITPVVGLFLGIIHGVGLKIMLEYGTAENTSKYSTINEIIVGLGFGLTPIVSGYVIDTFLYGIHWFLTFLGPLILISLIILSKNVKKEKE